LRARKCAGAGEAIDRSLSKPDDPIFPKLCNEIGAPEYHLKQILRFLLDKQGYVLWKRQFLRFGTSPFLDMARLNSAWGRSLNVLFDVGANIGQFASEARQELPAAKIYSFEPHPRTFEKLIGSNTDKLIFPHSLALSDKEGEVTFYEYGSEGDGTQINSLIPNARFPMRFGYKSREIKVRSSTLDRFCAVQNIDQVDFLKIDAEGDELSVLNGGKDMLSRGRIMAVYMEFNDLEPMAGATGGSLVPIARYLGEFGLRYACTYTDRLLYKNELHVVANALFVLPGYRSL
jgi:FkbM family methyltransferase